MLHLVVVVVEETEEIHVSVRGRISETEKKDWEKSQDSENVWEKSQSSEHFWKRKERVLKKK